MGDPGDAHRTACPRAGDGGSRHAVRKGARQGRPPLGDIGQRRAGIRRLQAGGRAVGRSSEGSDGGRSLGISWSSLTRGRVSGRGTRDRPLPQVRTSPVALGGRAALARAPQLAAGGFDLADGGGAGIDRPAAAGQLVEVRRRYAPVVGVLADGAAPGPDAEALDGLVRLGNAAVDLPPLLRTLIRAARDRSELERLRRSEDSELRKTKEFLERLIDATSDGIVAADLRGGILLFNKAAERMTGFSAALVGRTSVRELYPRGLAERIMQRLRASRAAGEEFGRMRCEVVARGGEVIPVDLSAAIVAEDGRDTATVGVFRDLREELRREAELRHTRERLEEAEKAAVVSELAGAAAHELNQPLTNR